MTRLPDKPSQLIRLALADLEKVERDARYDVDMGVWHDTEEYEEGPPRCYVCLAGSVMAGTLGANREDDLAPGDFDDDTADKLHALDAFRRSTLDGLGELGVRLFDGPNRRPPTYHKDRRGFKSTLRQIADDLEGAGL